MKRVLSVLLSAIMLLTVTTGAGFSAYASTYSGSCGDSATWSLDTASGELVISGTGAMTDYDGYSYVPWFEYYQTIKSITVEEGITTIGDYAFCLDMYAASLSISSTVTEIGFWAFAGCYSLTSITIPAGVTSIDSSAFLLCGYLTEISVSSSNQKYSSVSGVLFNKAKTQIMCYPSNKSGTSYTIPSTVTTISGYAFNYVNNLTSVTIPGSVTSIYYGLFEGSESLTEIKVDSSNTYYCAVDGILFNNDITNLVAYPAGKEDSSYVIPSTVTTVCAYAFSYCVNLTSVILPSNVSSLGYGAFEDCEELTRISILNPECEISSSKYTIYEGTQIYGYSSSTAQTYAESYDRTFIDLDTHQHEYTSVVTAQADCTSNGAIEYTCSICNYSYTQTVSALGHSYAVSSTVNPTCTVDGYITYTCSVCSATKTTVIPATGHTSGESVTENYVTPTCTADGSYDSVYYCTTCGTQISRQTVVISSIGHDFGNNNQYCSVCGAVNPNYVAPSSSSTSSSSSQSSQSSSSNTVDSVVLSEKTYVYNGKKRKPIVIAKDGDGNIISTDNYTVTYANGRKNVGKYKVVVNFKGNYRGKYTLYFTIKPKNTEISSIKAGKNSFVVEWKKRTKQTTGYQLQVSTSKKFTKSTSKLVTNKNPKQTTATVKGSAIKSKKTYYVRVRTYKTVDGKKIYSNWSTVKKVTTK